MGFFDPTKADPNVLVSHLLEATVVSIFKNGTFTTQTGWKAASAPDRLIGFDYDSDSMRRKSVTGRGAALLLTGGMSGVASNNRGVLYVTVAGEKTGARTFTMRNPSSATLTAVRSMKAAADSVIAKSGSGTVANDPVEQLEKLAALRASGALTEAEFQQAKTRLLQ